MHDTFEQKKHRLFVILCGIFITNAVLAEVIGTKIFSFERTFGADPVHFNILGEMLDFNLTAGVLIWPIVFVTSDLINEYFGKPGVKRISYFTIILISYSFVILFLTIQLHPADFWLEAYKKDDAGNAFNINYAFQKIFGQGLRIIIGSLTAFLIGQLVDVFVFQKMKRLTGHKMLWLRATGSTLVSQLVDSYVVLFIAFYGTFPTHQIVAIGVMNYIYKFIMAIVLTPLIYIGHGVIDRYLGKDNAEMLSAEAVEGSKGFF